MNTHTNIKDDICHQQQKIIASLREEKQALLKRVDYLEEQLQEYKTMKILASQGMSTQQANQYLFQEWNKTRDIEAQRHKMDYEARQAEAEEDKKRQILDANPRITELFNTAKAKAEAARDMMLQKAEDFYCLDKNRAYEYASLRHSPKQSAVKHLILEITEGGDLMGSKQIVTYECDHCKRRYHSLETFERHCYDNGDSHHDPNMKLIKDDCIAEIAKAKTEMDKDIIIALQAADTAALRAAADKRRAYETKAKRDLPYVNK